MYLEIIHVCSWFKKCDIIESPKSIFFKTLHAIIRQAILKLKKSLCKLINILVFDTMIDLG